VKGFFCLRRGSLFRQPLGSYRDAKSYPKKSTQKSTQICLVCIDPRSRLKHFVRPSRPFAPPFTYSCTRPVGVEPTTFGFGNQRSTTELRTFRNDRIRTCDPLLPKQMRYQTALHSVSPSQRLVYKILPSTATQIKKHIDLLRPFDACIFTL